MAIEHKRSDSLDYLAVLPESFPDGYFVGWTITSQIRSARYYALIADLSCAWVDPVTTRSINVRFTDTTTWPVGPAVLDVRFIRTSDGTTISTDTVDINIVHDVTTVPAVG